MVPCEATLTIEPLMSVFMSLDRLSGLPEMLIQVGTAETLLDDAHRLSQASINAGVSVDLRVWDDMVHVWHWFAPLLDEGLEALNEAGAWIRERTAA